MIMEIYKGICHICSKPYADAIDHVVPVAKGGSDHPDNLRPAHTACNSKKGARSYPKWAEQNPNMWEPGHLPAETRRRLAAESARKRAEEDRIRQQREAERQRSIEEYERLSQAWSAKSKVLAALERDKPRDPLTTDEAEVAIAFGLGGVAVTFVSLLLFSDPGGLAGFVISLIFYGFIAFFVSGFLGGGIGILVIPRVKRRLLRSRFDDYQERLAAWQALVDQWTAKEPQRPPIHPDYRYSSSSTKTMRKKPSSRRSRQYRYR